MNPNENVCSVMALLRSWHAAKVAANQDPAGALKLTPAAFAGALIEEHGIENALRHCPQGVWFEHARTRIQRAAATAYDDDGINGTSALALNRRT